MLERWMPPPMSFVPEGPRPPDLTRHPRPATLRLRRLADALVHLLDHPDVGSDEIATFVALARYCDADGRCHPSQTTLASQLHRSRPWINARIATLCALGILEKAQRFLPKGGQTSCRYRIVSLAAPLQASGWADGPACASSRNSQPPDTARQHRDTMNLESLDLTDLSLCAPAPEEPDGGLFDAGNWAACGPGEPVLVCPVEDGLTAPAARPSPSAPMEPSPCAGSFAAPHGRGVAPPLTVAAAAPPCPLPWSPSAEDLAWAAARRPDIDLAAFTTKFRQKTASDLDERHPKGAAETWARRWRTWLIDEWPPRGKTLSAPTDRRMRRPSETSSRSPSGPTASPAAAPSEDMHARVTRLGAALAVRLRASPMETVQ